MRRSYQQFCPMATALDVVGDRWTALILRDLSFGPRRFRDLEQSLDGIGPNLLSQRLEQLQDAGLVEKRVVDGTTYAAYARTPLGDGADEFLIPLSRWGVPLLAQADPSRADPRMAPVALRSMVRWEELDDHGLSARLELDVGTYELVISEAGEPGRRMPFSRRIQVTMYQSTPDDDPGDQVEFDVVMRGSIFSLIDGSPGDSFTFVGDETDVRRLRRSLGLGGA